MAVGNRKRGFGGPATKRTKAALRAARGSDAPRASLYDEVTAKIITQLEAGCFPWAQPWSSAAAVPGLPRNAVSGRPYSGVNVLILWGAVIEGRYPSQDWLTFRQALAAGGCVRKGERGHTIFYADRFTPDDGREGGDTPESEPRSIPFLKRFVVFNAAQCHGLPERLTADPTPLPEREQHESAEALIAAADAMLLEAADLQVDESLLTGESLPVRKLAQAVDDTKAVSRPGGDDQPFVYSGSLVSRGTGLACTVATGALSEIGRVGVLTRRASAIETLGHLPCFARTRQVH